METKKDKIVFCAPFEMINRFSKGLFIEFTLDDAMTANAFEEDRQNAFAAGMNGHIAKPIEVSKLLNTLAEVL